MNAAAGLSLQQVTLAVQHLYRDGERVAAELGGVLRDGGWFPGTGVGHKYVDVGGVRVHVVSVVDYRASRASEFGYAVYEAARTGTTLFRLTYAGQVADELPSGLLATRAVTETYRRSDGTQVPATPVLLLPAGPTCELHLADERPQEAGSGSWRVGWATDVDWASEEHRLGLEPTSATPLTEVTYEPAGISYRAADPAVLMSVRRS